MKGRKPTPTHLKLVTGNRGKRKINASEPVPVGDLFYPPEWFTPELREDWAYAIQHAPAGLLRKLERDLLAVYIVAAHTWRRAFLAQASADAQSLLPLLSVTPNGMAVQSSYIGIMNKQAMIMLRAAAELGFTPSSRSRIAVDAAKETDPLAEFG